MDDHQVLISRQLQRETESFKEARLRFNTRTRDAEDRSYASSTCYGRKACIAFLEPISARIEEKMSTLRRGKAALDANEVVSHLNNADKNILSLITLKVLLDVLGKDSHPSLQSITIKVGKAVQLELRMNYYAEQEPDLYKKVEYFFHKSAGTKQKATVFKRAFNNEEIIWPRWSETINHKVGAFLLTCLMEVTGWVERCTHVRGLRRVRVMKYTDEFLKHREAILEAAESMAFCRWPMLCPPVKWTDEQSGGYLTESVRQSNPLVRRASSLAPTMQGALPIEMLNNIQSIPHKINKKVLEVAERLYELNVSVGKFKCDAPMPIPENLLAKDAPDDEVLVYKRARRDAENSNSMLRQKNWRTTENLYVARLFKDDTFFLSASFDYRGRVGYQSTFNPQGDEFEKSLFYFAEEGPINEPWLAWHLASCWGLDKKTHDERIAWTRENKSLISAIAEDPFTNHQWRDASEPWPALAAILEYYDCCINSTKTTSGLPCGIDATNSGIQHLSSLTLSNEGALVNVAPTDQPADGYRTVAEQAKKHLPEQLHGWIHRGVCKRVCMCLPYGLTESSARNYLRIALKEDNREFDSETLTKITHAVFRYAVPEIFPGAVSLMKWLKGAAKTILDSGRDHITWTSPSGFIVRQDLRLINTIQVQTRLMGGVRIKATIGDGWLGPDKAHHKAALPPNLTHSLDAALLHLTFAYWDRPFSCIHDCVLGRSCDMTAMSSDIRMHFAEMYKAPVLMDWAAEVGVEVPEGLIKNSLDIEAVNDSLYFFC